MNRSELKQLIREEIQEVFRGFDTPTDHTIQLSPERNERMFGNLKKKAEELYNEYTQTGRVPGFMGYDKDIQKWKNPEELEKINRWFVAWSRALKTGTTYNDLFKTLEILPDRLKEKFKDKLGNISENEKERN